MHIFKKNLTAIAFAVAAVVAAGAASAATFTVSALDDAINPGDSGVEMSSQGLPLSGCWPNDCATVSLASGLNGYSFDLNNVGDSHTFNFLTFQGPKTLGLYDTYDVAAQLAFSAPVLAGSDTGFAAVALRLGSFALAGTLDWDNMPIQVGFGNGGIVEISFQEGTDLLLHLPVTTTATVKLVQAEVPLPAAGLLLVAGLGGLAVAKRRRKTA